MPLRLDVKRKLLARSDRVKCVDLHPTETWVLVALYNGNVHIWNFENQQLVKSFEVFISIYSNGALLVVGFGPQTYISTHHLHISFFFPSILPCRWSIFSSNVLKNLV